MLAGSLSVIPGCGGGHKSLATRQADLRNVEMIIVSTSQQCRTSVGAMADALRAALAGSGSKSALDRTAQAAVTACSITTDEEIQDLSTLAVPADLASLRLEQAPPDLTAWAADATAAAKDIIRLGHDSGDAAAAGELESKITEMQRLAQSAQAGLAGAAATLHMSPAPLVMPSMTQVRR
ncbi:MAG: hypothetical protein NVS3B18_10270 [Candidatus Dormibacteria bacterium]